MTIFVPSYWPLFNTSEKRVHQFPGFYSTFEYDAEKDAIQWIVNTDKNEWLNTWYIQYRPGFGIAEFRDDYPQTDPTLKTIFGPTKIVSFSEPIGWGENQNIGQVYSNKPTYDMTECVPPVIGGGTGFQAVLYEELLPEYKTANGVVYKDVLRMLCEQTFGSATSWLRLWMAGGMIGPVAVQFSETGPVEDVISITKV